MDNSDEEKLWEIINECIKKIINCEVFGFDLTACYAVISQSISKLQKMNPIFEQRHYEWKEQRAKRISNVIKDKMQEIET